MSEKKDRRIMDEVTRFTTLLGPNTKFTGRITGSDNCIINGRIMGDCALEGVLVLGQEGIWEGDIVAPNAVVSGRVAGSMDIGKKIELTRSARVQGALASPMIAIEEGAVHDGEIRMKSDTEVVRFREKRKAERKD